MASSSSGSTGSQWPATAPAGVLLAIGWELAVACWEKHLPDALEPALCQRCQVGMPCLTWQFADGFLRQLLEEAEVPLGKGVALEFRFAGERPQGHASGTSSRGQQRQSNAGGTADQQYQRQSGGTGAAAPLPPPSMQDTAQLPVVERASVPVLVPPATGPLRRRVVPRPWPTGPVAEAAGIFPPVEPAADVRPAPSLPAATPGRHRAAAGGEETKQQEQPTEPGPTGRPLSGLPSARNLRRKP